MGKGDKRLDPLRGRTVVLYDPFPLWLDAVERAVVRVGLEVRGKTTDFDVALTLLDEYEPDVLVSEIVESEGEGRRASWVRDVQVRHPEMKTIVLSSMDDPAERTFAFAAGAAAYVLKSAHPEDIALAVRQVFEHSISFAHSVDQSPEYDSTSAAAACDLTPREVEILQLVSEGHSNSKLAAMLWVTEQTVKFHLSNIYRKLDVANRTEASRWAQLHGLLPATTAARVQAA
jgi:DNA-binding NarL/FixJ family response regulator